MQQVDLKQEVQQVQLLEVKVLELMGLAQGQRQAKRWESFCCHQKRPKEFCCCSILGEVVEACQMRLQGA